MYQKDACQKQVVEEEKQAAAAAAEEEGLEEKKKRGVPAIAVVGAACRQPPCYKQDRGSMDLIAKPRSKSIVWMYFGLKADDKGQPLNSGEAICRLCRKIVLAKGGNTTNLRSHLKRRHRAEFFENPSSTSSAALFEAQGDFT